MRAGVITWPWWIKDPILQCSCVSTLWRSLKCSPHVTCNLIHKQTLTLISGLITKWHITGSVVGGIQCLVCFRACSFCIYIWLIWGYLPYIFELVTSSTNNRYTDLYIILLKWFSCGYDDFHLGIISMKIMAHQLNSNSLIHWLIHFVGIPSFIYLS